ncbi:MAG: hypothetical protein AB7S75_15235 [Desulfococcaceae bacterium]
MKTNETINEIRKTRKEISRKFNFDPKRLVEFYKEKQKIRVASGNFIEKMASEKVK